VPFARDRATFHPGATPLGHLDKRGSLLVDVAVDCDAGLADERELRPVMPQTFPPADAAVAYGPPPTRRRPGKTVLVVRL